MVTLRVEGPENNTRKKQKSGNSDTTPSTSGHSYRDKTKSKDLKAKKEEKTSSRETTNRKSKTPSNPTNSFAEPNPETASLNSSGNHTYPLRSQSKRSEPSTTLKSSLTRLNLTQAKRFDLHFWKMSRSNKSVVNCYSRSPLGKRELAALGVASSSSSGSRPTATPAGEEPGPSGLCRSGAVLRRSTRSGKGLLLFITYTVSS